MIAIGYAALALLLPAASLSQPVAPPRTSTVDAPADSDEIVVTGFSKPYKLTGKQLATALKVFRKYRPVYAPEGKLLFEVSRKAAARNVGPLRLTLRSGNSVIPITLDATSRFVLPEHANEDWELVANRGSGAITIAPLVLSPGSTEADRTVGDMRLQCEVAWAAFVKPDLPFALRPIAAVANGCRRSDFALMQSVDTRIASGLIVAGRQATPMKLGWGGMSFRYPGYDKRLPNSARARFRYD